MVEDKYPTAQALRQQVGGSRPKPAKLHSQRAKHSAASNGSGAAAATPHGSQHVPAAAGAVSGTSSGAALASRGDTAAEVVEVTGSGTRHVRPGSAEALRCAHAGIPVHYSATGDASSCPQCTGGAGSGRAAAATKKKRRRSSAVAANAKPTPAKSRRVGGEPA